MTAAMDVRTAQSERIAPETFQSRLIENLIATLARPNSPPCLLRAPTGAGKTFMLARVLERTAEASPTMWFWFVPFVNLVQQTEDAIAANAHGLVPVSLERGRNQEPMSGLVILATAQSVARAKSRRVGYTDAEDDTTRSLEAHVALARARGLAIGLVVDEAHIGLDSQTEFGRFAQWLAPERLLMATATPKDDRLIEFIVQAGYGAYETFTVSRDDVVTARLNKRYVEAVIYDLRQSMQSIADLQQTVLRQAWRRNERIKARLKHLDIPITPLLLVQVANGPDTVAQARRQLMLLCDAPPSAIGEHTSDEPDPVMMASIANDSNKEVLIFKQSAGTGFDAPRAFVLASTKPVNDPDFATQFLGRIMRVHRSIRRHFAPSAPIDPELDTAYVYLANAVAQQGFEQAVAATAQLRTQLEGQAEKLVARKTAAGALVYTNRATDEPPLFYDAVSAPPDVESAPCAASEPGRALVPAESLGLFEESAELESLDILVPVAIMPGKEPPKRRELLRAYTKAELLRSLADLGITAHSLRKDLKRLPVAFASEARPEMEDMAAAARTASTRLEIAPNVRDLALATAFGRVRESEIHTELTRRERTEQEVVIVISRTQLAQEAMRALATLPQVEEEDARIIIDVLARRMRTHVVEHFNRLDPEEIDEAEVQRLARDAAFVVIRREHENLAELLHEEIAAQARMVDAGPLPDVMLFAADVGLEASRKNIYGVLPPAKEDVARLPQLLTIDARAALADSTLTLKDGTLRLAAFDGAHAMGQEERAFAKALDRAAFVQWWHRNPDRKAYSVRLVRGEHRNYFYPDYVVCLEHIAGDEPIPRLIETKESVKDAVRKSRRASPRYGRVLFVTKDQSKWRWINADGSLGGEVDLDDLSALQDWMRASIPG